MGYELIALGITVVIVLLVVVALLLPTQRYLERSILINAPVSLVFGEVNCFKKWNHWSPWAAMDKTAVVSYEGPEEGSGSSMLWEGDKNSVGKGKQEMVVSEPDKRILTELEFEGFNGSITAGFKFEKLDEKTTNVTWSNSSVNKGGLFTRYIDAIIYHQLGKQYEKGLQSLKAHVENLTK